MKTKTVHWTRSKIKDIGFVRCGIIPFLITDVGKVYFCLGVKNLNYNTCEDKIKLTDFSSERVIDDKDIFGTGLRSCRYLSLGIFSMTQDNLKDNSKLFIFNDTTLVILVQFDYIKSFNEITKIKFKESGSLDHPFFKLKWLDETKLSDIVNRDHSKYFIGSNLNNILSELSLIGSVIRN